MHQYIQKFFSELKPPFSETDLPEHQNTLDFLWAAYTEQYPINSTGIRQKYATLDPIFSQLSFDNSNLLFSVTAELCAEYEHLAFLAGLRLGAYLIAEMLQAES